MKTKADLKLIKAPIFKLKFPYFIMLNGPPSCGKSTIANHIYKLCKQHNVKVKRDAIAGPVKQLLALLLGKPYAAIKKDEFHDLLEQKPRNWLIDLIESYLKENYGDDFLPKCFYYRNLGFGGVVIADDSGMDTEIETIPSHQRSIIRVMRPGFDFRSDSRNYIANPNFVIRNDLDLTNALSQAEGVLSYIIKHNIVEKDLLKIEGNQGS